ncbi:complement C4-B [Polymixia lowei]
MACLIRPILLFILTLESVCAEDRFFISAPRVFHVGVKEKVFVQLGGSLLNKPVTLYLKDQFGERMSEEVPITFTKEGEVKSVELMIDRQKMSSLPAFKTDLPYLLLVLDRPSLPRSATRVLVSQRKGYIFIQTDQPIYNPTQKVRYRIFTLDHKMRPQDDIIQLSVFNAGGNRIMKILITASGGIFSGTFNIPDVSEMGTWKIVAHYEEDSNVATREFKVQKFVLPSFEVAITMEQSYLLLHSDQFNFNISAMYAHGGRVKGAYHCRFGVVIKGSGDGQKVKPVFIRGLELTGSITDGKAAATIQTAELNKRLHHHLNKTLPDLEKDGTQLYLAVSVVDVQSGELQEAEVSLSIVSHRYAIDLSRTRSYFIPGVPLDVAVVVRHPNGSPAGEVPVVIDAQTSVEKSYTVTTSQEGAAFAVFNFPTADNIAVEVTVDGHQQRKVIQRARSLSGSYLYLSITNKMYNVGDSPTVSFLSINGSPKDGFLYYMVFSRGALVQQNSLTAGIAATFKLAITSDMTPSFRLIGYYYNERGDIITDSVWVDVKDECEKKVKVSSKTPVYEPGNKAELTFDLDGQRAKVALLVVDKAIYALNARNKLTATQVFSSMQSYDLGCSYGGGADTNSTLNDVGLSFMSQSSSTVSDFKRGFTCESSSSRQRRSLDLQQEMMIIKSNFSSERLQDCCARGFSLIPMTRACEDRVKRVSEAACAEAFLECCRQGELLRQRKRQEEARKGFGRTASAQDIEDFFFDTAAQYIRRYFPPSFDFKVFDVNGQGSRFLPLPDSITTWEIQAVSVSAAHGFCVAEPYEIRAFKKVFVSLRLPYSVKKYEQISIVPVIYNYDEDYPAQLAVHMEQSPGLCSPGSATSTSFVNITLAPQSSQFVTFSAVPMATGTIPIKIRLYDIEFDRGIDAIEKILNVKTEGMEARVEETYSVKLEENNRQSLTIDGTLPGDIVPDSTANIFAKLEGQRFGQSSARALLSPLGVASLLNMPAGCAEQTMSLLAPTALALRYLDITQQWSALPTGARDKALAYTEKGEDGGVMLILISLNAHKLNNILKNISSSGYSNMVYYKNQQNDGSYGSWPGNAYSQWLTAYVVKVMSLLAERQSLVSGQQGRMAMVVSGEVISHSASFLLKVQMADGSFVDPHQVITRYLQGDPNGKEAAVSMTAFITLALQRSLQFLNQDMQSDAEESIRKSTTYLLSKVERLETTYAVAITAYCLSVCLSDKAQAQPAWRKLQALATEGIDGCRMWRANEEAVTIEATAYALLTAVALGDSRWADSAACWLISQENFKGGFKSTQDTIVALEALAEYDLRTPAPALRRVDAQFTAPQKADIINLSLEDRTVKVEKELKKLMGNNINVWLSGEGGVKLKVLKAYHLLEPKDSCELLTIKVNVEGKVQYTAKVVENYDYYGEDYSNDEGKEEHYPQSAIEWFDARTRHRRDTDHNLDSGNTVTYEVCVSHSLHRNLTGMAIADITLLSGFEAQTVDLDRLKELPEQYISHYEVTYGRVVIYFNELMDEEECIKFDAIQTVPIGLLQPASASFYDYYEPDRKCTVFYAAPERSKMVSKLCSGDVCQCAERPCHKKKSIFDSGPKITKTKRLEHACFSPTADYGYIVEVVNMTVKSNFELYTTNVTEILRAHGDLKVNENDLRVFVKRLHCKGQLETGKRYLIMGKDGATTDSNGQMQYLLESNTWIEQTPAANKCKRYSYRTACKGFQDFVSDYKINGCRQ